MSGAYRDDREAARAKIAELQAELEKHRAKRFAVTEMKEAVDAITNPRRLSIFPIPSLLASFTLVVVACSIESIWLGAIGLVGVAIAIVLVVRSSAGPVLPPPAEEEGETEEQKRIRFRIAEANVARIQLDEEQQREIDDEERICTALQEEIDEMRRLVGP